MHTESLKYNPADIAAHQRVTSTAPRILAPVITPEIDDELEHAQERFYAASDLIDSDDPTFFAHVEIDRREHAHCLCYRFVDLDGELEFLHRVSGLPRDVCAAWNYRDQVEMAASGLIPLACLDDALERARETIAAPDVPRVAVPT